MNNSYRKMEAYALRDAFLQYYQVPADTLCIIAGILTERGTGRVMNNVKVRLLPENTVFNGDSYNNGFHMFDSLPPGTHKIRFETPGYMVDSIEVNVTSGSTVFADREIESLAAPVVVSSTPVNNDTAFAASGQIRIVFSKVMDTASVRSTFSITPSARGTLQWSNNNTTLVFKPDSLVLPFNTFFTLRVEATARSESGLMLDGNGDGTPGDPFILTFKTRPVDAWPPRILSAVPGAGMVLRSPNHVLNFTFDEPLNPATVTLSNVAVQEVGASVLPRTVKYSEANGRGGINVYITNGLMPGRSYRVRISGVADQNGNSIPSTSPILWEFSVAPSSFQFTTIDDFNAGPSNWWQPSASGSTTGIDSARFSGDSIVVLPVLPTNTGSAQLRYYWRPDFSDWLIREYLGGGTPRSVLWRKQDTRLQVYIHGDGSGTLFRFAVDDSVDAFPGGRAENHEVSQWQKIDWVGWRLVEWDLESDPVGSWIGNGKLEGALRFDSFQLKY
ncbi:MAG: Ig-like domain-containing protein, partial [Bacteroidota bacterium]